MIQIAPGDLVAVTANNRCYYALILDRVRLFGGYWTYVFHRTSPEVVAAEELLSGDRTGFHAFVDFIWAKREGRIQRLARKQPAESFTGPGKLKGTHAIKEKAAFWFIYDMSFKQLARVERLSREQARYPLNQRIDDIVMTDRVDQRWLPENDPRI